MNDGVGYGSDGYISRCSCFMSGAGAMVLIKVFSDARSF